jgi:hypothetical protein
MPKARFETCLSSSGKEVPPGAQVDKEGWHPLAIMVAHGFGKLSR